ncbi:hypothetical protein GDO86_012974 [Hymenochirus boettgeri]|nr:hypothetical protein GDO86_012974 [Hymenochirus boettgeri]
MDAHPIHADERYVTNDDSSYVSCVADEPHHNDISVHSVVGYSQTFDRPYRDLAGGGGGYTTVPRNYHFRGPGVEPTMPMISQSPHPGYSSLSRPNQRYRSIDPYRGPGYGPQPQVRAGGLGGSQADLLAGRIYGSEDAYGLDDDRRSLGGYIEGPDYSTTGRRGANGDPRRRLRSYEDPLSEHFGSSLPASSSLSSLGPAPLTLAPHSGTWRQPELPEVLAMLSYTLDAVRLNAAAYLQHLSYRNEEVKKEVCRLRGIPPLISLLEDPRAPVRLAACGALKNLSYGPAKENKMAVKNCDGVPALARLLRRRGEGREGREMAECVTGKHALNSLVVRLSSSSQAPLLSEDTTVCIISTIQEVISGNLDAAKRLRESQGIERLVLINKGGGRSDREIRAAGFCLQTVWGYKELRKPLEKDGWKKSDFQVSTGISRVQVFDDGTLPIDRKNEKRSENAGIPLNDLKADQYSYNGDGNNRHLEEYSELDPLKEQTGSINLGDAEDQPV